MLYREIIAVCSQIHTKHTIQLCGQNVDLLNVTTGLNMANREHKLLPNLWQHSKNNFSVCKPPTAPNRTHASSLWQQHTQRDMSAHMVTSMHGACSCRSVPRNTRKGCNSSHYMNQARLYLTLVSLPSALMTLLAISNQPSFLLSDSNWITNFYSPVVTICTTSLTFNNSTFCPHNIFMCFVWIWEQTAIISLHSINWLVCINEMECVYCAVWTGCLYASKNSDLS